MNTSQIGAQIKALRKERGMTLTELAERSELSLGFLSNLEHNQTSPTIANLHKICNALNITLNDILISSTSSPAQPQPCCSIVRADERRVLFEEDNGQLRYESMTSGNTNLKLTSMIIKAGSSKTYSFSPHDHDELGIVVQGTLALDVNGKKYFLYPGDTIYIHSGTMHSGQCLSDEDCVSYWAKISSSYDPNFSSKANSSAILEQL